MNLTSWAQEELDRLITSDDDGTQVIINQDIMEVVKIFSSQGHSGSSASYSLSILKRLLDYKPITELTGEDSEWSDVSIYGEGSVQQNRRCSSVFRKNNDNLTAYCIEGKVFSDDGGKSWFTNSESFVPVTFPYYVPEKPEYIIKEDKPCTSTNPPSQD